MALVYPVDKGPAGIRSFADLSISTNADGITGADILDCNGLVPSAFEINSVNTDTNYSFRGCIAATAGSTSPSPLQTLVGTTGNTITLGSTGAGLTSGKTFILDPSQFAGIRYLQIFSGIPGTAIANATGAKVRVYLSSIGPVVR